MRTLKSFLLLFLGSVLVGCSSTPVQEELPILVYPSPPEQPRYYFEHTLVSSAQVRIENKESRLKRFVTGEIEGGEGLAKPFDVSACKGRIFVSDTVTRSIQTFDFPNGRFYEIGTQSPGELAKPLGIDTDAQCNVYVADITSNQILMYDQEGRFLKVFGGQDMFDRVSDVATDPQGKRLFALDTGGVESENHRIRVFDTETGEHLYDIGSRGTGDGQLNLPKSIDMGPDRKLYVVDSANFRVVVFEENGDFSHSFGSLGRHMSQFARPKGIAVSGNGLIFVADASHGNFQIFNEQGELLLFVGTRGTRADRGKYLLPAGIDVDEDGRVYFVGQFFRKVDVFRPAEIATDEGYLGVWPKEKG